MTSALSSSPHRFKDGISVTLVHGFIFEVTWSPELHEITLSHVQSLAEYIKSHKSIQPAMVLFNFEEFVPITPEARVYAASIEACSHVSATAVVVYNMAQKLVFNFFMRVNKPCKPTRSFGSRDQAIDWLESMRNMILLQNQN